MDAASFYQKKEHFMAALSYTVGGRYFATQKDLQAHVSALLQSYRPPVRLDGADAALMSDLLLRHPSAEIKVGCGVRAIWVRRNGPFGKGFYVERIDDSVIDFSYKQCLRPFTHASKAKFAFRRAIDEQVLAVKCAAFGDPQGRIVCPITGESITWEEAHVDHEPPLTFAALLADYCADRGIDLETIELYEPRNGIGKLLPPQIEQDWAAWHRHRAWLRVISAEANIKLVR
jgi:hypothetical protein